MCAIFGGIGISEQDAVKALLAMNRGNDGISVNTIGSVVVGHRRHKVIEDNKLGDLNGKSDQPYYNADKTIALILNGEIFNYKQVRNKLIKSNYKFVSQGDSEVLLCAYLKMGEKVFQDNCIDMMFAVGIVNLCENKLIFARDWPGRVPLFYLCDFVKNTKRIVFSSQISGLLTLKGAKFKNIKELTPGYIVNVNLKTLEIQTNKFYKHVKHDKNCAKALNHKDLQSANIIGNTLLHYLDLSCSRRIIGNELPCLLFSGGLDSLLTTICIIRAVRKLGIKKNLTCYVFAVDGFESEDIKRARAAFSKLKNLGLILKEVYCNAENIVESTPDFIKLFEAMTPSAVSFYPLAIYYYLAPIMYDDGFITAIGGDGPDELLGAYDIWKEMNLTHKDMCSYKTRLLLMNNIHENILKRGSIIMMERGPIEMRFPYLENNISKYLLSIHPKWLTQSPELAKYILDALDTIPPFINPLLGNNFKSYLYSIYKNKQINFPLYFEFEKLFWKFPLLMAGLKICKEMSLNPDILISPKLRSQHGTGLTSLEKDILKKYKNLQAKSDKELFKKIWIQLFQNRLTPNEIRCYS